MLVQVCESLTKTATRERETAALREAMRELRVNNSVIVTRNEEERIIVAEGTITALPAWRFLLNQPDSTEQA
jgi:hypothetical protein